ncbi:glycoside hydrolase family 95 protein [Paenibacillus psychroresistens]|uniref:glycoside hydrolase family 95 protein n=1 Tax=Paenibacillus psychroresistens TaxID=1778678 RepID=UPI001D057F29
MRRAFVSKPDQVAVQLITAHQASTLDLRLRLVTDQAVQTDSWEMGQLPENLQISRDYLPERLVLKGQYDAEFGSIGYVVATRVIVNGGSSLIEGEELVVSAADSVLLLTKVERYAHLEEDSDSQMVESLKKLEGDYDKLLARHADFHTPIMQRCELKLSSGEDYLLSVEELLAQQHSDSDLSSALVEKLFDMGRYFLLTDSGEIPPVVGHTNINVNLQVCSGNLADLSESMEVFFSWVEGMLEQFRENANHIFGTRGIVADVHPDAENGYLNHYDFNWPHHYWISAAGWLYNEFWGHYLITGDKKFLEERIIPGLKEIALFYEDFLTDFDEDGYHIFYPSYSPESWPENTGCMISINAVMDIMVCREVLDNLLDGLRILGTEDEKIPIYEAILNKLPPYLLDEEGALKEWAWPGLEERYNHRHVSHHYDVWPGNAITWENTPELARAVLLSNRKRGQQDDSAHGIIHRALTAARLKDSTDVYANLKQLLEHGFINTSLMTNHFPYRVYFPDLIGALPACFIEMLIYSQPGLIELLPALPREMPKGSLSGVRCFTFAVMKKLAWNLNEGWIEAEIVSLVDQEILIKYRHGLMDLIVNGKEKERSILGNTLSFTAGKTVKIEMRLVGI